MYMSYIYVVRTIRTKSVSYVISKISNEIGKISRYLNKLNVYKKYPNSVLVLFYTGFHLCHVGSARMYLQ